MNRVLFGKGVPLQVPNIPQLTTDKIDIAKAMSSHLMDGQVSLVQVSWVQSVANYYGHFLRRKGDEWEILYKKMDEQDYDFSCLAYGYKTTV